MIDNKITVLDVWHTEHPVQSTLVKVELAGGLNQVLLAVVHPAVQPIASTNNPDEPAN